MQQDSYKQSEDILKKRLVLATVVICPGIQFQILVELTKNDALS